MPEQKINTNSNELPDEEIKKQEVNNKESVQLLSEEDKVINLEEFPPKKRMIEKAKVPIHYYSAYLTEKEGPNTGNKYKLNWNIITIGSADENSIVLEDSTVSYQHAKIQRQSRKFVLYDLMSENGVYLNGKKLLRPKYLSDFDVIQIGRTKLIFRKSSMIN